MAFIAPSIPDGFSYWWQVKRYPHYKIINGWKVEAKDGYYVCPDVWGVWECLKPASQEHKNKANFFFPVKDSDIEVATNINISGNKLIHKNGNIYVRVQIQFRGSPNLYSYGVMKLDRMEYVGE